MLSLIRMFYALLFADVLLSDSVWLPPFGVLQMQRDVAVRSSHSVLAIVICDHEGSLCIAYTELTPLQDLLLGESAALVAAVRLSPASPCPEFFLRVTVLFWFETFLPNLLVLVGGG